MFYYDDVPGALQTTNATPGTENDAFFAAPGARTLWWRGLQVAGRGGGLTQLTNIQFRGKEWTSTASSGGTGVTPSPRDSDAPAAKHTAGYATGAVTSGTGGPKLLFSLGCSATGPNFWAPAMPDDSGYSLDASVTKSFDLFVSSPLASMNYEISPTFAE